MHRRRFCNRFAFCNRFCNRFVTAFSSGLPALRLDTFFKATTAVTVVTAFSELQALQCDLARVGVFGLFLACGRALDGAGKLVKHQNRTRGGKLVVCAKNSGYSGYSGYKLGGEYE